MDEELKKKRLGDLKNFPTLGSTIGDPFNQVQPRMPEPEAEQLKEEQPSGDMDQITLLGLQASLARALEKNPTLNSEEMENDRRFKERLKLNALKKLSTGY